MPSKMDKQAGVLTGAALGALYTVVKDRSTERMLTGMAVGGLLGGLTGAIGSRIARQRARQVARQQAIAHWAELAAQQPGTLEHTGLPIGL